MIALAFALWVAPAPAVPAVEPVAAESILVTPTWLSERMKRPGLVIFEIGGKPDYDAGHIPGAQFITMRDIAAPRVEGQLALELPDPARLDSVLEARGVSDDSYVVLYFGKDWVSPTTRVFLTLEWIGLRGRVSILDGGLPAWRAENRPVTTDIPAVSKGNFTPRVRNDVVVDAGYVSQHLRDAKVAIIDARDAGFYTDSIDNEMPRGGHIAGAHSIPFGTVVVEDNHLKSPADLRAIFSAAGAEPGDTVVSYCHIGQQGTLVFFAARLLGYNVRLYDGSFEDWSKRSELPVEGSRRAATSSGS
jgi:thiosulfate/3-mercaptopyruvate sulfurtransferase